MPLLNTSLMDIQRELAGLLQADPEDYPIGTAPQSLPRVLAFMQKVDANRGI